MSTRLPARWRLVTNYEVPPACRPAETADVAKPPGTLPCPLCAYPRVRSTLSRAAGQFKAPGGFSLT